MIRYTPNANWCGSDSFTYRAYDGSNTSTGVAIVNVNIICVNDAPVAVNDSGSTNRNTPITMSVLLNDTDVDQPYVSQTLSISGLTAGSNGTVSLSGTTQVIFTPST